MVQDSCASLSGSSPCILHPLTEHFVSLYSVFLFLPAQYRALLGQYLDTVHDLFSHSYNITPCIYCLVLWLLGGFCLLACPDVVISQLCCLLLSSTQLLTPPFLYPALDTSFSLPSSWHLLSSTQILTPPFLYPALDTSFPLPSSWHLLSSTQLLTLSGSVFSRCSITIKSAGSSNISQPLIHFRNTLIIKLHHQFT